ncbi:DUF99 family protein [Halobaculum limi]|uniref:endonuclease dU n=1 Tax=Halobaculum limi TaxID=3031916 RepID=UPI0024057355|nr:DUF99 family protein [Halobaculum sp. YSMS11]
MKSGTRALGVAVSSSDRTTTASDRATVAGAVVRVDRVVDGASFATCTVGGTDATDAVIACVERLDREDVRYLLLAGVAPAWFNVVDLNAVHTATDRPVLAVSFEASEGLEPHIREHFEGEARERRLATYESLPERVAIHLGDDADATPGLWVRAVGVDDATARRVVRAHLPDGQGRPEPLRVARMLARAGRGYADRERAARRDRDG